jgi:hypothetical protein
MGRVISMPSHEVSWESYLPTMLSPYLAVHMEAGSQELKTIPKMTWRPCIAPLESDQSGHITVYMYTTTNQVVANSPYTFANTK